MSLFQATAITVLARSTMWAATATTGVVLLVAPTLLTATSTQAALTSTITTVQTG